MINNVAVLEAMWGFVDASRDEFMWNAEWLHRSQLIGNVTDYAAVESGIQAYDVFGEITAPGTAR